MKQPKSKSLKAGHRFIVASAALVASVGLTAKGYTETSAEARELDQRTSWEIAEYLANVPYLLDAVTEDQQEAQAEFTAVATKIGTVCIDDMLGTEPEPATFEEAFREDDCTWTDEQLASAKRFYISADGRVTQLNSISELLVDNPDIDTDNIDTLQSFAYEQTQTNTAGIYPDFADKASYVILTDSGSFLTERISSPDTANDVRLPIIPYVMSYASFGWVALEVVLFGKRRRMSAKTKKALDLVAFSAEIESSSTTTLEQELDLLTRNEYGPPKFKES